MNVLWALIRKDWRVVKPVILVGVACLLLPAIMQGTVNAFRSDVVDFPGQTPVMNSSAVEEQRDLFQAAVTIGLSLWCAVCAALGGCMFARERRDRSAELVELLPVSRGVRLCSKVFVMALAAVSAMLVGYVLWMFAGVVWFAGVPVTGMIPPRGLEVMTPLFLIMFIMLGLSWMLSSMLRSEVIATAATFGAVCFFGLLFALVPGPGRYGDLYQWVNSFEWTPVPLTYVLVTLLALAAFVTGCIVTLRRREV
ncbi:MAG TPA: ABC transporter permease subunit [Phycisphaerales bacterium]|nr:ABC transporter permease subunit [Phycisphaerales bacterium]